MKSLKKGSISLNVTGVVNITAGEFPEIEINEKSIASYIAEALGLNKEGREEANFPGTVSLVVENLGKAEIKNTMTYDPDECKTDQGGVLNAM